MATVMIRVSKEVRDMVQNLAQPNETADVVLRRHLGMPEATDTEGLVRSLGEWPFKVLAPQEHVTIPWPIDPNTRLTDEDKVAKIKRAVYRHAKATGNTYHQMASPTGLRITRIK